EHKKKILEEHNYQLLSEEVAKQQEEFAKSLITNTFVPKLLRLIEDIPSLYNATEPTSQLQLDALTLLKDTTDTNEQ
ncbi:hypothetical protein OFC55_42845, partial [Escherichia coli]|nr:hypothetical protein [Escherichia coli]